MWQTRIGIQEELRNHLIKAARTFKNSPEATRRDPEA